MPTYEYHCDACNKDFILEQRITEKPIKKCAKCGKMKARRMISGTGNFVLKGGGWESDLYSGASNRKSSPAPSSDSSSSSSSSSSSGGGSSSDD